MMLNCEIDLLQFKTYLIFTVYKSIIKTDFVNFWFKFFLKSSDDSENSGDRIISKMRKKRRVKSSTPSKGEVSDDWDSSLKIFYTSFHRVQTKEACQ